jgi:CheY-like chemotaxis protein
MSESVSPFLLVEDNEDDVMLIKRAFAKNGIPNPIHVVRNGLEAMQYLDGAGRFTDRLRFPFPKVVLLDLKMPQVDGFEVLDWIRRRPGMRSLRVVVLTSSTTTVDVGRAYELGACSYLAKPVDFNDLCRMAVAIESYWGRLEAHSERGRWQGGT